jgi:galactoside O-acetyltransferase
MFLKYFEKRRKKKYILGFCVVEKNSIIGENFNINFASPPSNSKKYIYIGENSIVNGSFNFDSSNAEVHIGKHCYIGPSTFIARENIIIEDYAVIAGGSIFYTHNAHSLNFMERRKDIKEYYDALSKNENPCETKTWNDVSAKPIFIKKDVWVGMNCLVLKGTVIGEGAIVGAGSLVAKNIEPWTVVAGNPANIIKKLSF